MDKLLNLERAGGYPLCQENLKILAENAEMVNVVLSALQLTAKTAVILNRTPNGRWSSNTSTYIYVTNNINGEIVRVESGEDVMIEAYNGGCTAKVDIDTINQNITNEFGTTIGNVYQSRRGRIVECTSDQAWKFYILSDLYRVAKFNNLLPVFIESLPMSYISTHFTAPTTVELGSILESNFDTLRIKLAVNLQFTGSSNCICKLPIPVYGYHPLNSHIEAYNNRGVFYRIDSYINSGFINIMLGRWLIDNSMNPDVDCNDIVYINGEVVL